MAKIELTWDHLPRQAIERKYPPRSKGQDDGRRGLPSSNSTIMSDCERESISAGEDHIKDQIQKARPILNNSENKIDTTKTKIETNSFHDLPIDLKTFYSSEMSKFKQNLEQDYEDWKNANRDLESFKDDHQISREPILKTTNQILLSLAVMFVLLAIEIFANTNFLKTALFGGKAQATVVSASIATINVVVSFLVGSILMRNINHFKKSVSSMAYFFTGLYVTFYVWINFSLGVYRTRSEDEMLKFSLTGENLDPQKLLEFGRESMQPWLYISDLNLVGWALVIIGITFASIGLYDGYQFDDKYPGYGKIGKKENSKRKIALQRIADHKLKIVNLFNDFNNQAKSIHKIDMENIELWATEVNTFQLYFISYQDAVMEWESDLKHIIDEYRDNNLKYRQTPAPSYFGKPFKFSEKFYNASEMFSSMKNVFMNDQERNNLKNEMIKLVQNHYNSCSDKLDQLKSDIESNTEDFIKPYRII